MRPLADLLRPKAFNEVYGQEHLVGPKGVITQLVKKNKPISLLLWGPPGCGKTTIAKLYANAIDGETLHLSAILGSIQELKKRLLAIRNQPLLHSRLVIFVDEIHRFNKAQQDAFLPFVEDGSIILIGATTENPSFAINNALLSRLRVLEVDPLKEENLMKLIKKFEEILSYSITEAVRNQLIVDSSGDARHLLNLLENLQVSSDSQSIDETAYATIATKRLPNYDLNGEIHYQLTSALHKAIRGSDADAALYWLCRMLQAGEDAKFIARRLIRMASEDIGLCDPQALEIVINSAEAYHRLGSPEGELALAQAVVYLALAPKSNRLYLAFKKASEHACQTQNMPPPKSIINAPTRIMKELGYGKEYAYDHDHPFGYSGQNFMPEGFSETQYYKPVERGFEREMKKRLEFYSSLKKKRQKKTHDHSWEKENKTNLADALKETQNP